MSRPITVSRKGIIVVALAVLSVAGSFFVQDAVSALSGTAPDTSSSGGYDNSNSRFVLEKTGENTVTSISVPVYLPKKPTSSVSMSAVNFKYPWSANQPRISFQGGAYQRGNRNFSVPASAFQHDVSTGYYRAYVTAKLDPNVGKSTFAVAEFRLRVNVSGGLIGIGGGQRYSTIPNNYYTTNSNDTYNYSIPFATPCTVSSNTVKSIKLDDLDSGTKDNLYNKITVRVRDETAGTTFSLTQNSGSSMTGDFSGRMTFKPGHKYRLLVNNVHANNTLVYTFPYDNIAYRVGCAWNLLNINSQNRVQVGGSGSFSSYGNYHQGSTPRTVRPGDVVQFQHEVKNSGNMKTSTFSRWRERNGWQGMSGWPQQGGTFQSTLNAGQSARWPGEPTSYKIKTTDVGRTLCERYGVKGRSSTNSSAFRSVGSCVRVVTDWNLNGATQMRVNGATMSGTQTRNVAPGDVVEWQHTLRNGGPNATHKAVKVWIGTQDTNPTSPTNSATRWSKSGIAAGFASGSTRTYDSFGANQGGAGVGEYKIRPVDVGKTICRYLSWDPDWWNDTNPAVTSSALRCVTVPYNFTLVPNITVPENVEPGDTIPPIEGTITNRPPSKTKSRPVEWQINRFELAPGVTSPSSDVVNNSNTPCAYYTSVGASDCSNPALAGGTNKVLELNEVLRRTISGQSVDVNTPIGTRICFSISVKPWRSSGAASWRHVYACLTVNKRPTVQVWGGDVRANYIKTSVSRGKQDGRGALFGSWVEYGAFAVNPNVNYASGAALAKGSTSVSNGNDASLHGLTFANTGATRGSFGQYVSNANELTTQLANNATATSGSRTFAAGSIGKNTTQIIKVNGTATITGNLTYGGEPYSSIGQIPQRVIIADRIYIRDNVTRIDAWLIAPIIDTCSNAGNGTTAGTMPGAQMGPIIGTRGPGQLVSDRCDRPLRVNGPVIAGSVLLKRTGGSEPGDNLDARARAAEVFNLRPDAYLWLYNRFGGSGQMWTTGSRDLPPRF